MPSLGELLVAWLGKEYTARVVGFYVRVVFVFLRNSVSETRQLRLQLNFGSPACNMSQAETGVAGKTVSIVDWRKNDSQGEQNIRQSMPHQMCTHIHLLAATATHAAHIPQTLLVSVATLAYCCLPD